MTAYIGDPPFTSEDRAQSVRFLTAERDSARLDADRLRAQVDALRSALEACALFIADDTCRHDYEKGRPLAVARSALEATR